MRAIIAAILLALFLATIPQAEEAKSYVVVANNAPYPIIAEVHHRFEGTVARVPIHPGEEARLTLSPGNYMLSVRPAVPFYFVGLSLAPGVLLQNPYLIVPIGLGAGERYVYTYTLSNLTQAKAGLLVLKSALNITALIVDDQINVKAGAFPADDENHYTAIFMFGEGNHTILATFSEERPILCLMKYKLNIRIRTGDMLVVDIPQNPNRYVKPINITNKLSKPVLVGVHALSSDAMTESYAQAERMTAYTLSRELMVSANSGVVINACIGRYRIKAWGINSPKEISLETWLNITDSSDGFTVTVPDSLGGGALTIRPAECVTAVNVSGEDISLRLRGGEDTTLLLPPGEYLVSAEISRCGIINEPDNYATKVSAGLGDDLVVEVPPLHANLTITNSVDYELVVSIVNPAGGLVHATTIPPSSQVLIEVWPGNYTIIAHPFARPEYYVGPVSSLRWETSVLLEEGDSVVVVAEPSAHSMLEVEGPPGAKVLLAWGTSSASYLIPPGGVLRLSAAPTIYNISSCPGDVFHACWSTTVNLSGEARVIVRYGLRLETVAGTALIVVAAVAVAYLVMRRRR